MTDGAMGGCSSEAPQIPGRGAVASGIVVLGPTGISHRTNLCPLLQGSTQLQNKPSEYNRTKLNHEDCTSTPSKHQQYSAEHMISFTPRQDRLLKTSYNKDLLNQSQSKLSLPSSDFQLGCSNIIKGSDRQIKKLH